MKPNARNETGTSRKEDRPVEKNLFPKKFPGMHYSSRLRLLIWRPEGVLDDDLIDNVATFVSAKERIAGQIFNRFTDLTGLTHIRVQLGHIFTVANRRRTASAGRDPVKSAIFSDSVVGFGIARLYETLMQGASVKVRPFRTRAEAAKWLGVDVSELSHNMGPKSDG